MKLYGRKYKYWNIKYVFILILFYMYGHWFYNIGIIINYQLMVLMVLLSISDLYGLKK